MGILSNCNHVSTTVWQHHFDETPGEKARFELHKTATSCLEQKQLDGNFSYLKLSKQVMLDTAGQVSNVL